MELWILFSACHLMMSYICSKFQNNNSGFKNYKLDAISILKFIKGHNSIKKGGLVTILVFCSNIPKSFRVNLYICTKFHENFFNCIKVTDKKQWFKHWHLWRGIILLQWSWCYDTCFLYIFCTLSDNALYLYRILWNISKGFRVIWRTWFSH